ncbi:MAG TPA: LysR family transcriptional regulator [Caulobacteraceae bacterium]|nr:LysR family transcriptional regulator [Caulobacteraceae bacterium]
MSDIDEDDIRRVDGGLLLVFRELVRRGRTTAAAERLGLSQSAVSHALARLRDLFADPLFVRRPHGLEPTRRALELAPRIDALIDMIGAAVAAEPGFDPARSRRWFNLAGTEFAAAAIDGAFVQAMRQEAPGAGFVFQFLRGYMAVEALRRGQLDMALGRFDTLPSELRVEPLYEDRYCVVARADHPTIRGRIDSRAWRDTGHVFCAPPGRTAPDVGEDPLPNAAQVATTALVPRWEMALWLVAGSDAIATCPRSIAEQHARVLGLQILEPHIAVPGFTISAARRAEPDPGLEWLLGLMRRRCETLQSGMSTESDPTA